MSRVFIFVSMIFWLLFTSCSTRRLDASDINSTISDNNNGVYIAVPRSYYQAADKRGSLETFTYSTKDYIGDGNTIERNATVYLPYGYNPIDRYNILYLQHGAYGNERTWMYEYGDSFKNMIDHMIEDELIPPLIIVMPYLSSGKNWYHDTTPIFYKNEISKDLMPELEAHYHTYAEEISDIGFKESRNHRLFGGFSAGATTTWNVFVDGLDRFSFFMPLSGALALGGDGSTCNEDASRLADSAKSSGYGKREYLIFAATGTRDIAYQGLSMQIEAMKSESEAFDYAENSFEDGNLMYLQIAPKYGHLCTNYRTVRR